MAAVGQLGSLGRKIVLDCTALLATACTQIAAGILGAAKQTLLENYRCYRFLPRKPRYG
jgi:hypothetical protein